MAQKGKVAKFHCDWCEKRVTGLLILWNQNYSKGEELKWFYCHFCKRITSTKKEGVE